MILSKLRIMIRIRLFEERVSELKKQITGPIHTYIGQEAIATGVCLALRKDDFIIGNHRSHGHLIAKGTDTRRLMEQVFKGNGSSMHVSDPSAGAICSTAIVGSGLPMACGVAFASKFKKEDNITCVFFGDGAANEGVFYESINLASSWKLPVLFILENNGVAVTTTSDEEFVFRAESFKINCQQVYGQDVDEVYDATLRALDQIKRNGRPALIEAKTMRFREHQEGNAYECMKNSNYRNNEEVKYWIDNRDPIKLYSEKLIREKLISQFKIDEIYVEESELIDDVIKL